MPRITPEEVVAAYKKNNLQVMRCSIQSRFGCCAIGAICPQELTANERYNWATEIYGTEYLDSFIKGFDGYQATGVGYDDGVAAYKEAIRCVK